MDYTPEMVNAAMTRVRRATYATCAGWAHETQEIMRANAPWSDHGGQDSLTGLSARDSLEVEAAEMPNGDILIVGRSTRQSTRGWRQWSNGAPVGAFLELGTRYMARRAIIWPTMTSRAPVLKLKLDYLLGGGI